MKIKDLQGERLEEKRYINGEMKFWERRNYEINALFSNWNESLKTNDKSKDGGIAYTVGRITPARVYIVSILTILLIIFFSVSAATKDTTEQFTGKEKVVYSYSYKELYIEKIYSVLQYTEYETFEEYYDDIDKDKYEEYRKSKDVLENDIQSGVLDDLVNNPQLMKDIGFPTMEMKYYNIYQIATFDNIQDYIINSENYEINKEQYDAFLNNYSDFSRKLGTEEYEKALKDFVSDEELINEINVYQDSSFKINVDDESYIYFLDVDSLTKGQIKVLEENNVPLTALKDNLGLHLLYNVQDNQYQLYSNFDITLEQANMIANEIYIYTLRDLIDKDDEFFSNDVFLFLSMDQLSLPYVISFIELAYNSNVSNDIEYKVILIDDLQEYDEMIAEKDDTRLIEISQMTSTIEQPTFIPTNSNGNDYLYNKESGDAKIFTFPEYKFKSGQEITQDEFNTIVEDLWSVVSYLNTTTTAMGKNQISMTTEWQKYIDVTIKEEEEEAATTEDLSTM